MSAIGRELGEAALRKLIQWGPEVAASADDLARFGPNAARVRALLEFIPRMSEDATKISDAARRAAGDAARDAARYDAWNSAGNAALDAALDAAWYDGWQGALGDAWGDAWGAARRAAGDAARGEVVNDLITPQAYRTLTNPLAAGRAVDLLRNRPRFQNTPFLDVVRQAAERGAVTGPRDVVAAGRIARSPESVIETALAMMADGMPAREAMVTARLMERLP